VLKPPSKAWYNFLVSNVSDRFGFPIETWRKAKLESKSALEGRAKVRGMMPYSELVRHIHAIPFEAHDVRLFALIGEITEEEDAAGRGMMSALVVHKVGDMQPGPGFFELAERLGKDTSDILRCWIAEVKKVHAVWSRP
jgi:hypothetical protein